MIPLRAIEQYLADIEAIHRYATGITARRLLERIEGWTAGASAATYDPHRTSPPNHVDDDGVPIPSIPDPTARAALDPPTRDHELEFRRHAAAAQALRAWLAEHARPTTPEGEERLGTLDDHSKLVAGRCEVCDRPLMRGPSTGIRKDHADFLHYVEERILCDTHRRARSKHKRKADPVLDIDHWISTTRTRALRKTTT